MEDAQQVDRSNTEDRGGDLRFQGSLVRFVQPTRFHAPGTRAHGGNEDLIATEHDRHDKPPLHGDANERQYQKHNIFFTDDRNYRDREG